MVLDILAIVSVATLSATEIVSPSSLRISAIIAATSISLLLASGRRSYFIVSILLSLCVGGYAAVRRFRPSPSSDDGDRGPMITTYTLTGGSIRSRSSRGIIAGAYSSAKCVVLRLLPAALASLFHLLGLWILPFCILFGIVDARSDPDYFGQEVGHLAPATFYVVGLVILPLLILPRGYESALVRHQMYESTFNVGFSLIYFIVFRTAHHFEGQDPPRMSAPNWDHEFLGVIFCGAGLVGVFLALQGIQTSIHVAFPTAFVAYTMLSHSNAHNSQMDAGWQMTWMKLHAVHGMLFGIGALCRLLYRIPESIFFFYLGSFAFVVSAKWVVQALDEAVNYKDDPESREAGRYPTDHVVPLLVVAVATSLFALFLACATRLRQFLDMDADVAGGGGAFEALPTGRDLKLDDACGESNESRGASTKDEEDDDEHNVQSLLLDP